MIKTHINTMQNQGKIASCISHEAPRQPNPLKSVVHYRNPHRCAVMVSQVGELSHLESFIRQVSQVSPIVIPSLIIITSFFYRFFIDFKIPSYHQSIQISMNLLCIPPVFAELLQKVLVEIFCDDPWDFAAEVMRSSW